MKKSVLKFLKLNWIKVLTLILIIISSFTIGIKKESEKSTPPEIGISYTKIYINPIFWLPYFPITNCPGGEICFIKWVFNANIVNVILYEKIIFFLITLIYWYLISCLIFLIYEKVRK